MGKRVRSAKGELVDFDVLKIKEQLASSPPPIDVKTRQNFIENRLKRRLKKKVPTVEKVAVAVEPTLPEPELEMLPDPMIAPVVDAAVDETSKTKQKAKKKKI